MHCFNKDLNTPRGRLRFLAIWFCVVLFITFVVFTIQYYRFQGIVGEKCLLNGQLEVGRELVVESANIVLYDRLPFFGIRVKFSDPNRRPDQGIVVVRTFSFWEYSDIKIVRPMREGQKAVRTKSGIKKGLK